MSYDVELTIQTGPGQWATVADCGNMTSNVGSMYRLVLPATEKRRAGLPGLMGLRADVAAPLLRAALQAMEADPDRFRALEPANGWGNYESALRYLSTILAACEAHSWTTLLVSW